MKKILLTVFIVGLAFPLTQTFAASPGGSDTCGIGWMITEEKSLSATTTRGTTNAFVPPTLGMTSGTIGCDRHSIAAQDIQAARYAVTNIDALMHEMAIGSGETLLGLSQVMGCSSPQKFSKALKNHYPTILPHGQVTPVEVFKNIQNLTKGQCQVL